MYVKVCPHLACMCIVHGHNVCTNRSVVGLSNSHEKLCAATCMPPPAHAQCMKICSKALKCPAAWAQGAAGGSFSDEDGTPVRGCAGMQLRSTTAQPIPITGAIAAYSNCPVARSANALSDTNPAITATGNWVLLYAPIARGSSSAAEGRLQYRGLLNKDI